MGPADTVDPGTTIRPGTTIDPGTTGTFPAGAAEVSQAILVILRLFRDLECIDAGLTPSQYRIMKLAGAGGERSTRLAQRLAVAKPTLTATADGLVAAGYAVRAAEPGDRRVVRLSLTPAGRAALDRADAAYSAWLGELLEATGEPATVLDAFSLLETALAEVRRARSGGDGKGQEHEHRPEHHHERDPQQEGGR
jgi:DNA-binding MarR family transcriptional regulator